MYFPPVGLIKVILCSKETGTDAGLLTKTQTSLLPHFDSTTHIRYTHRNLQNNRLSVHWIYSKNRYDVYIYTVYIYITFTDYQEEPQPNTGSNFTILHLNSSEGGMNLYVGCHFFPFLFFFLHLDMVVYTCVCVYGTVCLRVCYTGVLSFYLHTSPLT